MAGPLYRQIADDLRHMIEAGDLPPGGQLPPEPELRKKYEASRNTVRDAVKALSTRGLVVTRPGQGTFVAERIVPFVVTMTDDPVTKLGGGDSVTYMSEARARKRTPSTTPPRVERQTVPAHVAPELGLSEGDQVVSRHHELHLDGQPWSLQTTFYPMRLIALGATRLQEAGDIEEGTIRYLRHELAIDQVGYRDTLTARQPNDDELRYFRLEPDSGAVVIETTRTSYDQSGVPMRCTVTVWGADRNKLVYNVGEVPPATGAS